jgi:predicted MPP superfamily phosphohydrolase
LKTIILFGDTHLEQDVATDPSYLLLKQVVQKLKPSKIICGGDLADFSYISRWSEGLPGMQEGKRLKEDFTTIENELKFFKKYAKEVVFYEGNHEARVRKYLEKNPVLKGLLSLEDICAKENVEYITTQQQPNKLLPDLYVAHGLSFNKFFTSWTVERMNENIITFHTHRTQNFTISYPTGKIVTGYGVGCTCSTNPTYLAGQRISGHTNSFAILYVDDDGSWQIDTVIIKDNSCIVAGKKYSLEKVSA